MSNTHQASSDKYLTDEELYAAINFMIVIQPPYITSSILETVRTFYGVEHINQLHTVYGNCVELMKLTDEYKDSVEREHKLRYTVEMNPRLTSFVVDEPGKTQFSGTLLTELQRLTQNLNETNKLLRSILEK